MNNSRVDRVSSNMEKTAVQLPRTNCSKPRNTQQNGEYETALGASNSLQASNMEKTSWARMTPSERSKMGVTTSFDFYNHTVNGKYVGTHTSLQGAIDACNNVMDAWMNNTKLENPNKTDNIYASSGRGDGINSSNQTSVKDFLTNKYGKGYAVGHEISLSVIGVVNPGNLGGAVSMTSMMQLGGRYGGYWYTYGNFQGGGGLAYGVKVGLSGGASLLLAKSVTGDLNPSSFNGSYNYFSGGASVALEFGVGGGWGFSNSSWQIFNIGASIGVGGGPKFIISLVKALHYKDLILICLLKTGVMVTFYLIICRTVNPTFGKEPITIFANNTL